MFTAKVLGLIPNIMQGLSLNREIFNPVFMDAKERTMEDFDLVPENQLTQCPGGTKD
jgi:hypothetical protein